MRSTKLAAVVAAVAVASSLEAGIGSWTPLSPMRTPRWDHRAAVVDGKVYVFGGNIYSLNGTYVNQYLRSVEMYDPATGVWTPRSDMPAAVRSMTATAVGGRIYIIGGHDGSATYANVWEYDPATDTYADRAPMSTIRFHHAAAVVDGKIYVLGGYPGPYSGVLSSFEVYDPVANLWSPPQAMTRVRGQLAAAAIGSTIHVMGGESPPGSSTASVEAYDTTTGVWSDRAPLPETSLDGDAVTADGRVYLIGGIVPGVGDVGGRQYDPATDTWSEMPLMAVNRHGAAAALVGPTIYATGGTTSSGTTDQVEAITLTPPPPVACVQQRCADDVICDFNGGQFCGTLVGSASPCAGACDTGICLQGAGSIVLGDQDSFSGSALEIEAKVRLSRVPAPGEHASAVVTKYRGASPGASEWGLFVEKEQKWLLCGDGTLCISSAPGLVSTNTLYHVRARLDGDLAELWVDGLLVASGTIARNPANTATPVIIGNSYQPGHPNPFFGMIDELRIGCSNRPPVALCQSPTESTDPGLCSATASIDDGSFDPDGDPISICQEPPGPYALGQTSVTLTVEDTHGASDSCTGTVTVVDQEDPTLTCPASFTVECGGPAGTVVTFQATATDNCSVGPVSCQPPSGSPFPLGTTPVACSVADGSGNGATCGFDVTVSDTTPPNIGSVTALPSLLWPPNHKMVAVAIHASVTDLCDPNPACSVVSVASNEPVNGTGDGDQSPDWEITGPMAVKLRAERSGHGSGRIYTVTVECLDSLGNASSGAALVTVPHNN